MNQLLLLIFLVLQSHLAIRAQESTDIKELNNGNNKIWLGVKINTTMTRDILGSYSNEIIYDHSYLPVVCGGLDIIKELRFNNMELVGGINYEKMGYKEKVSSEFVRNFVTKHITQRLHYLSLRLIPTYRYKSFYFGLGPVISYFLVRNEVTKELNNITIYHDPKPNDETTMLDYLLFGITTYVGVNLTFSSRVIFQPELYGNISKPLDYVDDGAHGIGFYNFGIGLGIKYLIKQ